MIQWRGVIGWDGIYEVSENGIVKSLQRLVPRIRKSGTFMMKVKEKHLNPICNNGYLYVTLARGNIDTRRPIHQLVCEAFVGPKPDGNFVVNHKNGIKSDNRDCNLEWATYSQNFLHAADLLGVNCGEKSTSSILKNSDVLKIRELRLQGITFRELGEMFGVHAQTVHNVCSGKSWRRFK